jgi:hypothetical protein
MGPLPKIPATHVLVRQPSTFRALNTQIANQPHRRRPFLHAEGNMESPSHRRALFLSSCRFLADIRQTELIMLLSSNGRSSSPLPPSDSMQHRDQLPVYHTQPPTLASQRTTPCCLWIASRFVNRRRSLN